MKKEKRGPFLGDEKKAADHPYITLAITQPDTRRKKTNVARPSDEDVLRAKEWVDYNTK